MNELVKVRMHISDTQAVEYEFMVFSTYHMVFSRYFFYEKPAGKRKWIVTKNWDNYNKRDSNIPEPQLTDAIRDEAIRNYIISISSNIKTYTWDEWRNKS